MRFHRPQSPERMRRCLRHAQLRRANQSNRQKCPCGTCRADQCCIKGQCLNAQCPTPSQQQGAPCTTDSCGNPGCCAFGFICVNGVCTLNPTFVGGTPPPCQPSCAAGYQGQLGQACGGSDCQGGGCQCANGLACTSGVCTCPNKTAVYIDKFWVCNTKGCGCPFGMTCNNKQCLVLANPASTTSKEKSGWIANLTKATKPACLRGGARVAPWTPINTR